MEDDKDIGLAPLQHIDRSIFDLSTIKDAIHNKRDSEGNLKSTEAPAKPVKVRIPKVKIKLDADLLLSDKGLPRLQNDSTKLKFKGKGHEFEDLQKLISFYQIWGHQLYPSLAFESVVEKVEKVCKTRRLDNYLADLRRTKRLQELGLIDDYANKQDGMELDDDALARIEANKARALEIRRRKMQSSNPTQLFPDDDPDDEPLVMQKIHKTVGGSLEDQLFPDDDDEEEPLPRTRKVRSHLTLEKLFTDDEDDDFDAFNPVNEKDKPVAPEVIAKVMALIADETEKEELDQLEEILNSGSAPPAFDPSISDSTAFLGGMDIDNETEIGGDGDHLLEKDSEEVRYHHEQTQEKPDYSIEL